LTSIENPDIIIDEAKRLIRAYKVKWSREKDENRGSEDYKICALIESEFNSLMADFLLHLERMENGKLADGNRG